MQSQNKQVRVRFAPSPTGFPHVGNIRTALFNWLFARHHGGQFIVRIEDTDKDRAVPGSVEAILESLDWLGLTIDEGVVASNKEQVSSIKYQEKGKRGPYFQSKRLEIYKKHAEELVSRGQAYYCFCSEERLRELRQEQEAKKMPPKYDRRCLSLSSDEVKQKLATGEPAVIRMKVRDEGETVLTDIVKGQVRFQNSTIDDQVLLKSDGYPTYHLASVVDDHLMEISHVIRAEEWLPSTPKHLILYDYFGWEPPHFAHLPVILGSDRSKLSKRHGAVSVLEYREQGYLPEPVVNYLALLGWNPKTNQEIFSRDELVREFDLAKVNKANPIFDIKKLNWLNGQYIKKMSVEGLATLLAQSSYLKPSPNPSLEGRGLPKSPPARGGAGGEGEALRKAVKLAQERMEKLSDFESLTNFLWQDELDYDPAILVPKGSDQTQCQTNLQTALAVIHKISPSDWEEGKLRQIFLDYSDRNNLKRGEFLWPTRVAVTGLANSPDVFAVMAILGKEKSQARIKRAVENLSSPLPLGEG